MAARSRSFLVAAVALAAAAGLALSGGPVGSSVPEGASRADVVSLRGELDARLREVAAGVRARAATLAELPRLQAAVSTDAATVRDLTQDELAFRPKPSEVIEIGQVKKVGGVDLLWRSSDDAGAGPRLDQSGYHLLVAAGELRLAEVVDVAPRARAEELRGALSLSWKVDLAAITERARALGLGAAIEATGGTVILGKEMDAAGQRIEVPLESEPGRGARLVATLAPARPAAAPDRGRQGAAAAIAIVGLLISGLMWRRGGAPAVTDSPAAGGASPRLVSATGATEVGSATPGAPAAWSASQMALGATAMHDSAVALSAAPEGGTRRIGRYTVIRQLGSGGMADVFLATVAGEAGFEKQVALKVLHPEMARQQVVVDHFLDEARLASRLVHPNIVQIIDLGRADDAYFLAMEFVEGSDLERLLTAAREKNERVPLRVAFTIVRRILDGLHAAHTAVTADGQPLDLVHRDVKAANVFIARNGAVKVGDFGIAKANQQARVARTEVGQVKGTAAYMAPEHRIGQEVDARADIYSAGAIAYEVFTGQPVDLDLVKIAHLGREGWPHLAPPTAVRAELPAELDALIFKALAYDKEDRFPNCEAFEEALEAIASNHGISASDKAVAQWVAVELGGDAASKSLSKLTND